MGGQKVDQDPLVDHGLLIQKPEELNSESFLA